ncbi:MAG: DMT family transporter [Muribaculaceae bacterium]|nr:DMT family transporter [Muribaculaceae bacterium]
MNAIKPVPRQWEGHMAMFFANILWGAMSPVAKSVMQEGVITGVTLSALRIFGGTLLFLIAAILPSRVTGDVPLDRRDILKVFLASVIMISANQGLYILGISYTTPVDTAVMSTTTPVFTLVLAAIFIGMPMTPLKVFGVVLGIAGALILSFYGSVSAIASNPLLGDVLCLGAQMCAAIYYVFFLGVIGKYPPFTLMKWMFLFSSLTWVPCTVPWLTDTDWSAISSASWWSIAYIAVFPTFIAYMLIPFSQKRLKPTVVSMYAYLQPVSAAVLASVMGLAAFGWIKGMASMLIFAGVACVTLATSAPRHKA